MTTITSSPTAPSSGVTKPTTALRIGVLLLPAVQLLDLSGIDLFSMLTKEYLQACRLPTPLVNLGIPVEIHYISSEPFPSTIDSITTTTSITPPSPPLATLTASARLALTINIHSPTVSASSPGRTLEIILIPGPNPSASVPAEVGEWLREHYAKGSTLMSVCTGIFVLADSGVLEGKQATGPRGLLGELRGRWPGVEWVEKRWCTDRNRSVWCSGGITNGLDMVAAYLKEKYPGSLSDTVCTLADVGDRGQEYNAGNLKVSSWWIWNIVRAWMAGG